MITLTRRYELEVAHQLKAGVTEHHKCRRLHGHRYVVDVSISGQLDADGMLVEYDQLDRVIRPIFKLVDHYDLNSLPERCSTPQAAAVGANPTVERLCEWLAFRLALVASARQEQGLRLARVVVEEDSSSRAEWTP